MYKTKIVTPIPMLTKLATLIENIHLTLNTEVIPNPTIIKLKFFREF